MAYAAHILDDSISPAGHRLTSFEVTFPRIVLAEVNTHKMISKNSASSRAIPVVKRIEAVTFDPFVPEQFGKNQKGMQHTELLDGSDDQFARHEWHEAKNEMVVRAASLAKIGVHKQLANRLLEPFAWHTAVLSGTDWDNFFHLRVNPAAQGEFRRAAEMMLELYTKSAPRPVNYGDWHTPYVAGSEAFDIMGSEPIYSLPNISAARCARVSYLTQDGRHDWREDMALFDRLVGPGHLSPLEHPARPMTSSELLQFERPRRFWNGERFAATLGESDYYLGNFNGWVQLRKLIPGEADILGHRSATA